MLLFMDGFDLYSAVADVRKRWDFVSSSLAYETTGGRYGGRYPKYTSVFDEVAFAKTIDPIGDDVDNKLVVSGAFYWGSPASDSTGSRILYMCSALQNTTANAIANSHLSLQHKAGGKLRVFRGATEIAASADEVVFANTWHRIEMEAYIHDSAGTVRVAVDGEIVINFTGDTLNGDLPDALIRCVAFGANGSTAVGEARWDDVAWWGTEDGPGDLIGDFVINTLFPNAAGDENDGTAEGAGSKEAAVDDDGAGDGDTSYVGNSTVGDITTFGIQNVGDVGDIIGVGVHAYHRAAAPGLRKVKLGVRTGGVNYFGDDVRVPSQAAYVGHQEIFQDNPGTSAPWTGTQINDLQIGYQLSN